MHATNCERRTSCSPTSGWRRSPSAPRVELEATGEHARQNAPSRRGAISPRKRRKSRASPARGPLQCGDRCAALSSAITHRRVSPPQGLHQARHQLAHQTRTRPCHPSRARRSSPSTLRPADYGVPGCERVPVAATIGAVKLSANGETRLTQRASRKAPIGLAGWPCSRPALGSQAAKEDKKGCPPEGRDTSRSWGGGPSPLARSPL